MNIKLKQLLPTNPSSETAFHLAKFINDLARALDSIYFDQMIHYTSTCEYDPFETEKTEENN